MKPNMKTLSLIIKLSRKVHNKAKKILRILLSPSAIKLIILYNSGQLVILPIGFRCWTKGLILKSLWCIEMKKSYPFDNGFFTPLSVARVLKRKRINLNCDQLNPNHTVCIKHEAYNDSTFGYGIKFNKSTYKEINSLAISRETTGINKYLDSTFGYYTVDIENQFILAHYNWHAFASNDDSNRVYNPSTNIENINNTLNRRLDRMFKKCRSAKYILFIFAENQDYKYMMIDDDYFDLTDWSPVEEVAKELFPDSIIFVKNIDTVDSPEKVIQLLDQVSI